MIPKHLSLISTSNSNGETDTVYNMGIKAFRKELEEANLEVDGSCEILLDRLKKLKLEK